jgi:predicted enzyme related to lactoylglutathione lyase
MAHLAFSVAELDFDSWVNKIKESNLCVITGPKEQRGGRTILFRTPSKNIVEVCYPEARKTIEQQTY